MRKKLLNERVMKLLDIGSDILVILNAVLILLSVAEYIPSDRVEDIEFFLSISLYYFIAEVLCRVWYQGKRFWQSAWSIFDLVVVLASALALLPSLMNLRLVRLFRLLRLFKLFSINNQIRTIIKALVLSVPQVLWTSMLILSLFCMYTIIGVDAFAGAFPEYFGGVGETAFTLFQVMTLESWASGIARQVMSEYDWAWLYFVSFILISNYILLNLLMSVITATTIEMYERNSRAKEREAKQELDWTQLKEELQIIKTMLEQQQNKPTTE